MKKEYKIYIDTVKHRDIYEYLEGLKKPARAEMIRAAIRLVIFNQRNLAVIQSSQKTKAIPDPPPLLRKGHAFG
jgi:hypothetical protein